MSHSRTRSEQRSAQQPRARPPGALDGGGAQDEVGPRGGTPLCLTEEANPDPATTRMNLRSRGSIKQASHRKEKYRTTALSEDLESSDSDRKRDGGRGLGSRGHPGLWPGLAAPSAGGA